MYADQEILKKVRLKSCA